MNADRVEVIGQIGAGNPEADGVFVVYFKVLRDASVQRRPHRVCRRSRRRKNAQPKFVELIGTAHERVDEYVIDFESARGRKLRIHCKTNTPPDWPALLRAWRREEP